jgi:6,7-dimethyl-8-ribityllumazine synthase
MKKTNLSQHNYNVASKYRNIKIAIVVSEWNEIITNALKEGALAFLREHGIANHQIRVHTVPGSFELPYAASAILDADLEIDGVVCLGCIIQGETRHFEFISQAVANGIMRASLDTNIPVIFGVLTCDTIEQAQDRAGGKHGNKGVEAAYTCLKMIEFNNKLS